jgi:hypothetical protein
VHARTREDACALAATQIARFPNDVPFGLLYLVDDGATEARLAGTANIEPGTAYAPPCIALADRSVWPLDRGADHDTSSIVQLTDGPGGARPAAVSRSASSWLG